MNKYKNINGNSAISEYEIHNDRIIVWFTNSYNSYEYSYNSAGVDKVEHMKQLAEQGCGLNSYIKKYANNLYEH